MDGMSLLFTAGAIIFGGLWLLRRRARLRSDKFE
jgi:hypothetical protein